jgi:hypothetical protein
MSVATLLARNVGTADRIVRIAVGLALLALAVTGMSPWGWLGLIPLATATIGSCPLYSLLGINTCPAPRR